MSMVPDPNALAALAQQVDASITPPTPRIDASATGQMPQAGQIPPAVTTSAATNNHTSFVAPPTFLTIVPGTTNSSLDAFISKYMQSMENHPNSASTVDFSKAGNGETQSTDLSVDKALEEFQKTAAYTTGLQLATTLTQSFNSAIRRLTQGQ